MKLITFHSMLGAPCRLEQPAAEGESLFWRSTASDDFNFATRLVFQDCSKTSLQASDRPESRQHGRPYSRHRDISLAPPPVRASNTPHHRTSPFADPYVCPDTFAHRNSTSRRCHSRRNVRSYPAARDTRGRSRPDSRLKPARRPNRRKRFAEFDGRAFFDDRQGGRSQVWTCGSGASSTCE
jgi:hypothetical protein